ncbi:isochorismatase family [Cordyceps militaris]|uniref:Isochorismatase family n=1 Tax=Cordyceps militaris TaxID=73501 RepID=A0A2H4SF44_CORMI|nr:isochorismatase family [Cordyceps militaris]
MIPTLKATVLLLVAVTGAAALTSYDWPCTPGDFGCTDDNDQILTCDSQGHWVVSAVCGVRCCREDRDRHTAHCPTPPGRNGIYL